MVIFNIYDMQVIYFIAVVLPYIYCKTILYSVTRAVNGPSNVTQLNFRHVHSVHCICVYIHICWLWHNYWW